MIANWCKYFLSTHHFMRWARVGIVLGYGLGIILIIFACYQGLFLAPEDSTQGNVYRILYVHVPMAVLSLLLYTGLAISCLLYWVFTIKIADIAAVSFAWVGVLITALALVTGMIWGKPTWGVWWVWDARLTSEALLWLLYAGYLAVRLLLNPEEHAKKVAAFIGFLGLFDVPLVHFSVQWWYTLHQGSSVLHFTKPSIAWPMLVPLLWSLAGFTLFTAAMVWHTMIVITRTQKKSQHDSDPLPSSQETVPCLASN
jgi:heme exporter protein C